jgi:hypothetical protein
MRFLATYLERQMDLGVLRREDPAIAARCFMGPLITYMLTRIIFHQPEALAIEPEEMLRGTVRTFLRGLAVQE